jgi:hypothetical protein
MLPVNGITLQVFALIDTVFSMTQTMLIVQQIHNVKSIHQQMSYFQIIVKLGPICTTQLDLEILLLLKLNRLKNFII